MKFKKLVTPLLIIMLILSACGEPGASNAANNNSNQTGDAENTTADESQVQDNGACEPLATVILGNVSVISVGGANLEAGLPSNGTAGENLSSFTIQNNDNQDACPDAKLRGIIIQTPEEIDRVSFFMNGIEISLGSTVFFTISDDRTLSISPVEGSARVNSGDNETSAIAGTQMNIPLTDDASYGNGDIEVLSYAENEDIDLLPIDLLERDIEISDPLDDEALALFEEYDVLFDGLNVEDIDEVFSYLSDTEEPDVVDYLINELDYTEFDDDVEIYLEDDLDYDLGEYEDYTGDDEPEDDGDFEEGESEGDGEYEDEGDPEDEGEYEDDDESEDDGELEGDD